MSAHQKKIRVLILYGGKSPEHEVSLSSAQNIINNLSTELFTVIPLKINKQGLWSIDQPLANTPADVLAAFLHNPQTICDVVFPIVHGSLGEDGIMQGLLEFAQIPYVGSGVLASAVGMDKDIARRLVSTAGLQVVPYFVVHGEQWQHNQQEIITQAANKFNLPLFVKPINQGSSIGVSKVKNLTDLVAAITLALCYADKILIEQAIDPLIEVETCLLEELNRNQLPFVSLVGEIRTAEEYYNYHAKYTPGKVEMLVPSSLSPQINTKIRQIAQEIFLVLGASAMARIDFFINADTQEIYFNEINTLPGFTLTSAYPMIMQASGLQLPEVLHRLIMLALKQFARNNSKETSYHQ